MARIPRVDVGGYVYHAMNRGNGRMTIFESDADYIAFERVIQDAVEQVPDLAIIAYCLMPNHWHLVLRPRSDGDLSRFVGWVTLTHTQRWHAHRGTAGGGHVYQGRFKSFLVDTERYLVAVCRYVERNPVRAGLALRAEDWRWSSAWRLANGDPGDRVLLGAWPSETGRRPANWLARVNEPQSNREEEAIRESSTRGRPFGSQIWQDRVIAQFGLEASIRGRGRPRRQQSKM